MLAADPTLPPIPLRDLRQNDWAANAISTLQRFPSGLGVPLSVIPGWRLQLALVTQDSLVVHVANTAGPNRAGALGG